MVNDDYIVNSNRKSPQILCKWRNFFLVVVVDVLSCKWQLARFTAVDPSDRTFQLFVRSLRCHLEWKYNVGQPANKRRSETLGLQRIFLLLQSIVFTDFFFFFFNSFFIYFSIWSRMVVLTRAILSLGTSWLEMNEIHIYLRINL